MVYKLIEYGPSRGVPALHFYRTESWNIKKISAFLQGGASSLGLNGPKKTAFFDGGVRLPSSSWKDDKEVMELIGLLIDFGWYVIASHGPEERPCWAGTPVFDVTVVREGQTLLGFGTGALVNWDIPLKPFQIPAQLQMVPKFLLIPSVVYDIAELAKFLKESPFNWACQIGNVGGMEVEL